MDADGESSARPANRLVRGVNSFFAFLSERRFGILLVAAWVVSIAVIRDVAEMWLLDREMLNGYTPVVYSLMHHVAFYVVTFLGLLLLLIAFSGEKWRRCMNFLCSIWPIIIIPPFLDRLVFGAATSYSYFSPADFLNYLIHFSSATFHPGQFIEIFTVIFGMASFTFWFRIRPGARKLKEGEEAEPSKRGEPVGLVALRIALLVAFSLMAMFFMATPQAYLPVGNGATLVEVFDGGMQVFPGFAATRYVQFHMFILSYYAVLSVALLFAIGYMAMGKDFKAMAKRTRPAQSFFFLAIAMSGMAYGWATTGRIYYVADYVGDPAGWATLNHIYYVTRILDRPFYINLAQVLLALTAAYLIWQTATIWNDVSDRRSDSREQGGPRAGAQRRLQGLP